MLELRKRKRKFVRKVKNVLSIVMILLFVIISIFVLMEWMQTGSLPSAKQVIQHLIPRKTPSSSNEEVSSVKEEMVVSYIDVGQGDSVLIQLGDRSILLDGGNNSKGTTVQKYLQDVGVSHLDAIISSHGDADHSGGLDVIAYKFPVDKCYLSYLDHDTQTYQDFKQVITDKNIPVEYPLANDSFSFGEAEITFVAPDNNDETDSNLASLAFVLKYGDCTYFFGGDNEKISYKGQIDVMMCPHHGSYTGNDIEKAYDYSYAVISVGQNEYGHPHDSTINILMEKGCRIYRTDEVGTIVSRCNGKDISMQCL